MQESFVDVDGFHIRYLEQGQGQPLAYIHGGGGLHPSRAHEWHDVDLTGLGPVAVRGANPIDEQTRADYFDALFHSAAVAGLNTSAFIEAAIVGRQVLTIVQGFLRELTAEVRDRGIRPVRRHRS